jgi:transposase
LAIPGGSGGNNRLFLEAVLWIARTGSPWRDLPEQFGKWNSVFVRYRDRTKAGVFKRLFDVCVYRKPYPSLSGNRIG